MALPYAPATAGSFTRHTPAHPCPVCAKGDWCRSFADGYTECMRVESARTTRNNGWLHFAGPGDAPGGDWRDRLARVPPAPTVPTPDPVDPDLADRAYRDLLGRCPLAPAHRDQLRARGLTDEQIERHGYGSLPADGRDRIAAALTVTFGPAVVGALPGLYRRHGVPTVAGEAGVLIPSRDAEGRTVRLRIRVEDPAKHAGGKYRWLSSAGRPDGAGSGVQTHLARPSGRQDAAAVRVGITEGAINANYAADRLGFPFLGLPGATTTAAVVPMLRELGATEAIVAFDNDRTENRFVARADAQLVDELVAAGFTVYRATWPQAHKGLDDALAAGVLPVLEPVAPTAPAEIPCADLRRRHAELSDLHSAVMALLGNANLNPAERIVAVMALKNITVATQGDPDAERHIPTVRIAEQAGVSVGTAATAIKTLEAGVVQASADPATEPTPIRLFRRRVKWVPDATVNRETGEIREGKQTFYTRGPGTLAGDLRVLATATKVKPRAHGGKRVVCPHHPNAPVVVKWARHCGTCDLLLEAGRRTEPPTAGVNEQDADLLAALQFADTIPDPEPTVGVNEQDAVLVQNPLPSEDVLSTTNLASFHNGPPAWVDEAPAPDEEPIDSFGEAWLAGAPAFVPRLDPVRDALAAADHAADRTARHRANADLARRLDPIARGRGRSPVPKPKATPRRDESGDDCWTRS